MSLVFIAVLAAIATQWAGRYSTCVLTGLNDATFYQAKASDPWAYYQSKSIKQNLYEGLREIASKEQDLANAGNNLQAFNDKVAKYKADEAQIMAEAKALEKQRNDARDAANNASRHGTGMGSAISIFQIAIALGSICLVTKKRALWYLSLAFTVAATAKMLQVWLT